MDMTLGGFVALGALITGLFAWLRQDIGELRKDMESKIDSLGSKIGELSERVARIEGFQKVVFMRRDLTPFPEPPRPATGRATPGPPETAFTCHLLLSPGRRDRVLGSTQFRP